MSEEEPKEPVEDEPINEKITNEEIDQITDLIMSKEEYSGHLSEKDRDDLIGGLKELSFLDPRLSDEPESKEFILDSQETFWEIYGMLEQFGIDAEKFLRELGLIEE